MRERNAESRHIAEMKDGTIDNIIPGTNPPMTRANQGQDGATQGMAEIFLIIPPVVRPKTERKVIGEVN